MRGSPHLHQDKAHAIELSMPREGELADAFGGEDTQASLLRADGIEVIDGRVNLKRYGISFAGTD